MQFEPRLFSPEIASSASDGEEITAGLPGELALLAEQLRDDAALLAERYPAEVAVVRRRRPRWAIAAAAALLASGFGWAAWTTRAARGVDEPAVGDTADFFALPLSRNVGSQVVRQEEPALADRPQQGVSNNLVGIAPKALPRTRMPAKDEAALLRRQVVAFEQVIERLQIELRERADQQSQTDVTIAELRREIAEFRSRLDERR